MMDRIVRVTVLILWVSLMAAPAAASEIDIAPFDTINQSPLASIYGLPGPGRFVLMPRGWTEIGVTMALANNFAVDDHPQEQIVLDGETVRLTFALRHAPWHRLELGLKIPVLTQGGGVLDSFIERYHSAFGFPQGGRDEAPQNRLLYRYRRNGAEVIRVENSGTGIGNLSVSAAFQLYPGEKRGHRGVVAQAALTLPTGDSDDLRGSGSTGLALWLTGGTDLGSPGSGWSVYGSAGALFLTEGDILPQQQRQAVGIGTFGLGWLPRPWLALKAQVDAHTPFFRGSELDELSAVSVQGTAGVSIGIVEGATLDLGISEDLTVRTSPDVVFYLALHSRF